MFAELWEQFSARPKGSLEVSAKDVSAPSSEQVPVSGDMAAGFSASV